MGKFTTLFTTMQIFLKEWKPARPATFIKKGMHPKMHPSNKQVFLFEQQILQHLNIIIPNPELVSPGNRSILNSCTRKLKHRIL